MFANFVARASLACLLCLGLVFAGCNDESADGSGASSSSSHGDSTALTGNVPNTPSNDNTDALNVLTGGVSSPGGGGTAGPMLSKPDNTEAEEEGSAAKEPEGSESKDDSGHDGDSDHGDDHDESGHEDDADHDDEESDEADDDTDNKQVKKQVKLPAMAEATGKTGTDLGDTFLEVSGEDVDGIEFSLSDYEGKVVMLDFWGHW